MSKTIKKAIVRDYRNFVADKSSNGGQYGYWTTYELSNEDKLRAGLETCPQYEVGYGTTAEFDYCNYCGRFGACICDRVREMVTEEQVFEALREANDRHSDALSGKVEEYTEVEGADSFDWTKIRTRCEDALRNADPHIVFNVGRLLGVKLTP